MATDYYQFLSVARNATQKEIKIAYRRMAEVYHPDKLRELPPVVRKEGEEIMRLLNEAKSVLLDPQKREEYDLTLRTGIVRSDAIVVGESDGFDDFIIEESRADLDGKMKRVLSSMKEVFVRDKGFQDKIAMAEEIVDAQVIGEEETVITRAVKPAQPQEMSLEFDVISRRSTSPASPPIRKKFRIVAIEEEDPNLAKGKAPSSEE